MLGKRIQRIIVEFNKNLKDVWRERREGPGVGFFVALSDFPLADKFFGCHGRGGVRASGKTY